MAGEAMVESTEAEKLAAALARMGGGRLPPSFSSVDAEMYAILAYLSKAVCELKEGETEASLADRRVLIMCDCAPCLKAPERAYRQGNNMGMHRKDRGGMIEAITHLRTRLGACVFLWNKSHRGASPSSYADLAAKTHLRAEHVEKATGKVGELVHLRPCLYERRQWAGEEVTWGLADKRVYREGRLRARANVRTRLAHHISPGATTAGQTERTWAEVARASLAKPKPSDGQLCLEDIEMYNKRVSTELGLRSGSMPGMPHDRAWEKRKRAEEAKGEPIR